MKREYLSALSFFSAEDFYSHYAHGVDMMLFFEDNRYYVTLRTRLFSGGYILNIVNANLPPNIKDISVSNRILFNIAYGANIPPEIQRAWTEDCLGYFNPGSWPCCETFEDLYKLYSYLMLKCIRGNIDIEKFKLKKTKTILL